MSRRRLALPAVIYKGSGFYTTDYARKGSDSAPGPSSESSSSPSNGSSSEKSGKSESAKTAEPAAKASAASD